MNFDDLRISRSAVVTVAQAASVFGVGRRVLIPHVPLLAALGVKGDESRPEVHDAGAGDR